MGYIKYMQHLIVPLYFLFDLLKENNECACDSYENSISLNLVLYSSPDSGLYYFLRDYGKSPHSGLPELPINLAFLQVLHA